MTIRRCLAKALDGAAAALARVFLMRRSRPNPNTLAELGTYRSAGIDALFGAQPELPEVTEHERRAMRGFRCTDLEYDSPHEALSVPFRRLHESAYQANSRVYARWLRHMDGATRPTVLFLHSWMQPSTWIEDAYLLPRIARALDVDIVRMQLPYHGRRKPKSSIFHGEYFWTADLVRTFEALSQSVHDARALVSYLEQHSSGPVGAMGMSLGGMVTLALSCFESRLSFAIPMAAHLDLAGVLEDASLLRPMRAELEGHGWGPKEVDDYTRSLGLADLAPSIPTDRLLLIAGKHDRLLHAKRTAELWERWQRPPIHWLDAGHLGIFTHLGESLAVSRGFLNSLHLTTPAPVPPAAKPTSILTPNNPLFGPLPALA